MSNMEEHVLIQIFNLLTCAQYSIACRMLSVISKFIYMYQLQFIIIYIYEGIRLSWNTNK